MGAVVAVAIAIAARPSLFWRTAADESTDGAKILVGPVMLSNGGYVQLERYPAHVASMPRLHFVTRSSRGLSDDDTLLVLELFSKALSQRRHFSVTWDVRAVIFPRISHTQFAAARDWIAIHVVAWDTYAQGHAVVVSHTSLQLPQPWIHTLVARLTWHRSTTLCYVG